MSCFTRGFSRPGNFPARWSGSSRRSQEPSKQGNIWYQEATYRHKNNTGRQVRGLHIMNPKGTMRAHAFMYSTNDDDLPVLKKVAENITFR